MMRAISKPSLAAVLAALPSAALAQNALPPPGTPPNTYAQQQHEQAAQTARLAASPLRHEWVTIPFGERTLHAYVTYPQTSGKTMAVIVGHEVFGLTDSTRWTADRIAALGYITVAPDFVSGLAPNGGTTKDFPNSRLTSAVMTTQLNQAVDAQFNAWADYALKLPGANGKLAIVGLSWSGGAAFRYAADKAHNRALRAVFVFYDVGPPTVTQGPGPSKDPSPPPSVADIDVPVFGFYPTRDTRAMNALPPTKDAMAAAGKPFYPETYQDADHAFMRLGEEPDDPNPANKAAVAAAMARLKTELARL